MKKRLLTLSFALLAAFAAKAQKPEMAQAVVKYKFTHLRDTTAKDKPYTENMVLFVGPTASAYKSYDRKLQEAMMRKQLEQQMAEQRGSGNMNFKVQSRTPTTNTEYYQFQAEKKLVRKERLITPYIIEEPMPVINWKISADTASFGTLHCQKATGHFKGRDYTAWFCPDLPFHTGPWKLNGLPGLIVEAYDTNKEVVFKFEGMDEVVKSEKPVVAETPPPGMGTTIRFGGDDPNLDPNLITLPTDAVKTSEKEFVKLQDAMRKDPQAFMAAMGGKMGMMPPGAMPAGGGGGMGPVRMVVNGVPGGAAQVINNPLELPEKK
ncbi:GLPGLI family protein [Mucilaginibacter boryungensis]|uniref:GLPGLI family protein n=1 Tax=Mucilaginibacter boryungensis TaxID=768480 RepID=A0ABR9XIA4_9SPHI|nr:GLPGLI family protein [Mucilaginibacter boryungensis]MBE9667101.1 GLPGLI family protein [Mucilaginibacter boryungensis]